MDVTAKSRDGSGGLLHPAVVSKLRSLRRLLRSRLLAEGFARLIVTMVVLAAATFALDHTLRLDRSLRLVILILCAIGVLRVLWRGVIRPWAAPMSLRDLATLAERRFPVLGDRLLTTLELAGGGTEEAGLSRAMLRRVADEANELAPTLPLGQMVEMRRLRRAAVLAAIAIVALGVVALARPETLRLWWQRSVLLADVDWPQDIYLNVFAVGRDGRLLPLLETGPGGQVVQRQNTIDVLRGDDLEILIETAPGSRAPDAVTLCAWYPSVGDTEERLAPLDASAAFALRPLRPGSGGTFYRKVLRSVCEELRFHVIGGDDRRDARHPHQVRLLSPPALLGAQFTVAYPPYMRKAKPDVLDSSGGVLPLPLGATVLVQAQAGKDLQSAKLVLDDKQTVPLKVYGEDGATQTGRKISGSFAVTGRNEPAVRNLRFALVDTDGYTNRRGETFLVQVLPDRPPSVRLRWSGVRNVICPQARIPLLAEAKDDYGVESIQIVFHTASPDPTPETPTSQPAEKTVGNPILPDDDSGPNARGQRELDLQPLQLLPGATVHVRAKARDRLPASLGGPNTAESDDLTFQVISREELLGQLVGKQKEVRVEFFQAVGQQELARGACEAAAGAKDAAEAARKLQDAADRQRMVAVETDKVAETLESIVCEMELNRLGKVEEHQALRENVIEPLRRLAEPMRSACTDLDEAKSLTDSAQRTQKARSVAQTQQKIHEQMEAVLANMQKLEDRLELVRRLEGLLRLSLELDAVLRQRAEKNVGDLFDPTNGQTRPEQQTPP